MLAILFVAGLMVVSCTLQGTPIEPSTPTGAAINDGGFTAVENETEQDTKVPMANETEPEPIGDDFDGFSATYTEGDLVVLTPEAIDPDGDSVRYEFGEPLTREGKWQTQIGDEGTYLVPVIASDGDLDDKTSVLLIIERANRPPVIDCDARATLREGERFYVGDYCEIYDEDGEEVVVYYSGWPGVSRYVAKYDDAGDHTLFINGNDKTHSVKAELPITVINVNRAPTFPDNFERTIVGMEGDIITIDTAGIVDDDGEKISFQFSKPFDNRGVWRTELGDAGTYDIDVVASDGESTQKRTVTVEIRLANTKPTLKTIPEITVNEGETITLPISATDREGDPLSIVITGWMSSETYKTTYDDAGSYTVKVTVSDGVHTTSQIVDITVKNVNRPPQFISVS